MAAARRRATRRRRKLKRRIPPRASRYSRAVHPPDGAILVYRLLMRSAVKRWWAQVGPKALRLAKQIAKPEQERTDRDDDTRGNLGGNSGAVAGWVGEKIGKVADQVQRHSDGEFGRIGIRLEKAAPSVAKLVPGFRKDNVALVKTMLDSEKSKLEQLLADGAGRRYESLAKDIEARFGITTRHAELIARDQTLKLNANITRQRMVDAGITTYVWTTAGDERVRELHDDLDGETFDFDDPPVTNEDGDTNNPGEDYQCRCVAFPVVPELGDDEETAGGDESPAEEPDAGGGSADAPDEAALADDAQPLAARADQFADALDREPHRAREILRDQVAKAMPQATSKDVAHGRPGAGKLSAGQMPGTANAYHDWDGSVVLQSGVKNRLERGARLLASGGFDEAFKNADPWGMTLSAQARYGAKLDAVDALRTAVHEEVHGFSRVSPYSYSGVGRILEEVGTELTARDIVASLSENIAGNASVREGLGFGSYHPDIDAVTEIVKKHAGVDEKAAHALIRKAHRDGACKAAPPFNSALEHLGDFVTGLDLPTEQAKAIHRGLLDLTYPNSDTRLPAG
jgi:SPP1 gp7 family putative phage head morphogenesis protein